MADIINVHTSAEKRLSITRETELLQSFVGIHDQEEETKAEEPIKIEAPVQKVEIIEPEIKPRPSAPSPRKSPKKSKKKQPQENKRKVRRRRKKGSRQEELYCDKDRAAAAAMGSKDIKQSLKLKRQQDRSRTLQIPEEAEPGTFLALGNYEMARGDLHIAHNFISKALELNPTEKNALVARSKCYILLGQPENALKDAETALKIDKNFMKAIYQKAESLYYLGDFEHSLMYYHRGLHIRPDHEGFKLGVYKSQKAIENALASAFQDVSKVSKRSVTPKRSNLASSTVSIDSTKKNSVKDTPKTSVRTTPVGKGKCGKNSRLLRELGADKEYLDNLINNPNIKCKFKEDDTTIEKCILETVEYLNARQEFWRQQLPPNRKL